MLQDSSLYVPSEILLTSDQVPLDEQRWRIKNHLKHRCLRKGPVFYQKQSNPAPLVGKIDLHTCPRIAVDKAKFDFADKYAPVIKKDPGSKWSRHAGGVGEQAHAEMFLGDPTFNTLRDNRGVPDLGNSDNKNYPTSTLSYDHHVMCKADYMHGTHVSDIIVQCFWEIESKDVEPYWTPNTWIYFGGYSTHDELLAGTRGTFGTTWQNYGVKIHNSHPISNLGIGWHHLSDEDRAAFEADQKTDQKAEQIIDG